MAPVIYALCALTAGLCAILLLSAWRRSGTALLLWSGLCFAGLTLNSVLLIVDKVAFPTAIDLAVPRAALALVSVSLLLFGMIWNRR